MGEAGAWRMPRVVGREAAHSGRGGVCEGEQRATALRAGELCVRGEQGATEPPHSGGRGRCGW